MSNQNKLLIGTIPAEELIRQFGSPLYVYDGEVIKSQYQKLADSISYPQTKIHYACKANTNLEILQLLREAGASIETVSKGEVTAALTAGYESKDIIYTCSNISADELKFLIDNHIQVNLDSFGQIEKYGLLHPNSNISIRINQGIGAGHHSHVITGGPDSKFGIYYTQIEEAQQLAQKYKLKITGIHQHIGSNILDEDIFMEAMRALLNTAKLFPDLEFIDFGGGFGIPYRPEEQPLNITSLGDQISQGFTIFCRQYGKQLTMRFETGRYLVAESGILLATVTDIKLTPFKTFVGIDTGFNHLIRPAMYDAYHHIVNASDLNGPEEIVTIAGNVCESGDLFATDRSIAKFHEGDILAIMTAGAYGYSMASSYNSRPRPAKVLVIDGKTKLIREREILNF